MSRKFTSQDDTYYMPCSSYLGSDYPEATVTTFLQDVSFATENLVFHVSQGGIKVIFIFVYISTKKFHPTCKAKLGALE